MKTFFDIRMVISLIGETFQCKTTLCEIQPGQALRHCCLRWDFQVCDQLQASEADPVWISYSSESHYSLGAKDTRMEL